MPVDGSAVGTLFFVSKVHKSFELPSAGPSPAGSRRGGRAWTLEDSSEQ